MLWALENPSQHLWYKQFFKIEFLEYSVWICYAGHAGYAGWGCYATTYTKLSSKQGWKMNIFHLKLGQEFLKLSKQPLPPPFLSQTSFNCPPLCQVKKGHGDLQFELLSKNEFHFLLVLRIVRFLSVFLFFFRFTAVGNW